jgi:beta-glucosidase
MSVYFDGMAADDYLFSFVWEHVTVRNQSVYIDFSQDPCLEMEGQKVEIPLSKLVIGLANGWALNSDQNKTLYISPEKCQEAYLKLKDSEHGDLTPRGFMFWTIEERGSREVYLARGIGKFIHKGHSTIQ